MKKEPRVLAILLVALAILLGPSRALADSKYILHGCLLKVSNQEVAAWYQMGALPLTKGIEEKCGAVLVSSLAADDLKPLATEDNYIAVWLHLATDNSMQTLGQATVTRVTLAVDGQTNPANALIRPDANYAVFKLTNLKNAANLTSAVVTVTTTETGDYSATLRKKTTIAPYGLFGAETYVWFPVGLFSTNFGTNANGLKFASMPIGLAVGFKWYALGSNYLGVSLIGSSLLWSPNDEKGGNMGVTYLTNLTVGAILDLNNWVYLGAAWGHDFRDTNPLPQQPGAMFVFGVAPGGLQLLQSKP